MKAQPLGVMCQLQNDRTGLGLGFPPWLVLFCFFPIAALAKETFNGIISKRKPGNGGKQ